MKRIEYNSDKYVRLCLKVALDFCPPISPCNYCGYPRVDGFRCERCHDGELEVHSPKEKR